MKSVYFYCAQPQSADMAAYHHQAICIAEGLKELNVPFYSNINYWKQSLDSQDYLFKNNPEVSPNDCSIVVLSLAWFLAGNSFPQELFHDGRKYLTVYLDRQDGFRTFACTHEFSRFDFILKNHYSKKTFYPSNFYPWAFGFSNRILHCLMDVPVSSRRRKNIVVNFRNKKNIHTVRKSIYRKFLPKIEDIISIDTTNNPLLSAPSDSLDYLLWSQTGKRHYPEYYIHLKESLACACFGGYYVPSWPSNTGNYVSRAVQKIMAQMNITSKHIVQWDSWRLWESWVAGCATFHVDFERYGILMPEMPKNWVHYIGIDIDNIDQSMKYIRDEPLLLENIARCGREWALKHYCPKAVANRFLSLVK